MIRVMDGAFGLSVGKPWGASALVRVRHVGRAPEGAKGLLFRYFGTVVQAGVIWGVWAPRTGLGL